MSIHALSGLEASKMVCKKQNAWCRVVHRAKLLNNGMPSTMNGTMMSLQKTTMLLLQWWRSYVGIGVMQARQAGWLLGGGKAGSYKAGHR